MATWQSSGWHMKHGPGAPFGALALCALAVWALPGCRGDRSDEPPRQFFPDMDDSPKWRPQTQTDFFGDGRSMRPEVPGTVPFGRWGFSTAEFVGSGQAGFDAVFDRADLLKEDDAFYRGYTAITPEGKFRYATKIPIAVDAALLKRGQERYTIYCAVCHGFQGRAEGMVGQRWTGLSVANLHDPKYTAANEPDGKNTDGFLFFTAMHGVPGPEGVPMPGDDEATKVRKIAANKMPPYSHALSERDAWAIVAYIRALQVSQGGSLADVPSERRPALEEERAKMPPPAPRPPTGVTGATGATGTNPGGTP
jgi:mono/diheme cytochrome c family protein